MLLIWALGFEKLDKLWSTEVEENAIIYLSLSVAYGSIENYRASDKSIALNTIKTAFNCV